MSIAHVKHISCKEHEHLGTRNTNICVYCEELFALKASILIESYERGEVGLLSLVDGLVSLRRLYYADR